MHDLNYIDQSAFPSCTSVTANIQELLENGYTFYLGGIILALMLPYI